MTEPAIGPQGAESPVTDVPPTELEQCRTIVQGDARRLGELVQTGGLDKLLRPVARNLLWRVWALLDPPQPDDGNDEPMAPVSLGQLRALAIELESLLRQLHDDRGAGARPIKDMRVATPMPDRVAVPPSARQTDNLARAVDRHFKTRVALTAERLAWFEARTGQTPPTTVAVVKQPEADAERQDLELLRKAGSSKFS